MRERERRIGMNEAVFRAVNEGLDALDETFGTDTEQMEVVCECGDAACVARFTMSPGDYERVRRDPHLFVMVPGHDAPDAERVVDEREGYAVVQKRAERGIDDLAEATNPRA